MAVAAFPPILSDAAVPVSPVPAPVKDEAVSAPVIVAVPSTRRLLSPASESPPTCSPPLIANLDNGLVVPMPTLPVVALTEKTPEPTSKVVDGPVVPMLFLSFRRFVSEIFYNL